MNQLSKTTLVSALALFCNTAAVAAPSEVAPLPEMQSVYSISWGGIRAGDADVSLKANAETGCYDYVTTTRPVGVFKALYGSPSQSSRFCIEDGRVRSQHFEAFLKGDEQQSYQLDFDYAKRTVVNEDGQTRDIPAEAVDSFSLQQAVRLWARQYAASANPPIGEFTMVDRKNLTYYKFKVGGRETIETPAGKWDTIRLDRIDNPEKIGRFWVAEARDYLPVKIETKVGDKPTVVMTLKQ